MTERNTADELARLSDADVVRRELCQKHRVVWAASLPLLLVPKAGRRPTPHRYARRIGNAAALQVVSTDRVRKEVERFRGRAQDDDVTVVVARVMRHGTIGGAWI